MPNTTMVQTHVGYKPGWCNWLSKHRVPRSCLDLPPKVTHRPDPCIYSQFFLMDQDLPVTWDNPDVTIWLGGDEKDTYNLAVSTTYRVNIKISNQSMEYDANATQVTVRQRNFGIGQPEYSPIGTHVLDVPAASSSTFDIEWTTPDVAGHYCIEVLISHPNDINGANNWGWNNTNVHAVQAGQMFAFNVPVWNNLDFTHRRKAMANKEFMAKVSEVEMTVDSYVIPAIDRGNPDYDAIFAERQPMWTATLTPETFDRAPNLARGQDPTLVELRVQVPAVAAVGTRGVFNVQAMAGERPLGGVTVYLDVT
ncbi:MAG: hypothetical protein ACTSV1_08475 [Alphaproteobacteria bacterium]